MTVAECIHQEFSMVGTISDYGVRRFAREWGYDPNSWRVATISNN